MCLHIKEVLGMRLQVNVADDMVERVDFYARKMGVSRSALCSVAIGQYVLGMDKSMDILTAISDKVGDNMLTDKTFKEVGDEIKK
jgi:Na+-translocating ferredoxin:NAD+ oxidoreductase RnfE subunit